MLHLSTTPSLYLIRRRALRGVESGISTLFLYYLIEGFPSCTVLRRTIPHPHLRSLYYPSLAEPDPRRVRTPHRHLFICLFSFLPSIVEKREVVFVTQ